MCWCVCWPATSARNSPRKRRLPIRRWWLVWPMPWPTSTTESSVQLASTLLCPQHPPSYMGTGVWPWKKFLFNKVHSIQSPKIAILSSSSFILVLKKRKFIGWGVGRVTGRNKSSFEKCVGTHQRKVDIMGRFQRVWRMPRWGRNSLGWRKGYLNG